MTDTTLFQTYDPVRLDAYERLLASPQPAGLPRGGQVHRWDGDPDRRVSRLPAIMMAWLQRRHLDTDVEEALTARVRTFRRTPSGRTVSAGLQLLRPTGTRSLARSSTLRPSPPLARVPIAR